NNVMVTPAIRVQLSTTREDGVTEGSGSGSGRPSDETAGSTGAAPEAAGAANPAVEGVTAGEGSPKPSDEGFVADPELDQNRKLGDEDEVEIVVAPVFVPYHLAQFCYRAAL
ncbi:hypothetical protein HK101_010708, partial [Irineochytrium annulatum]